MDVLTPGSVDEVAATVKQATGAQGTGVAYSTLASSVEAATLVSGNGDVTGARPDRPLSRFRRRRDDEFLADTAFPWVCRLGRQMSATVPGDQRDQRAGIERPDLYGRSDRVSGTPRRVRFTDMEYEMPLAAMPEILAAIPRILRQDAVQGAIPRYDDFLRVRHRLDPARIFTNGYLDRVLSA